MQALQNQMVDQGAPRVGFAYYNEIDSFCVEWLKNLIDAGLIADGVVDNRSIEDVTPNDLKGFTQHHFFAGIGAWSFALRLAGWPDDRPVWTGSCPCQPFSLAGKQKGFADERHLWPVFRDLIAKRRPATVFGEQVASATEWLRLVRSDLEALGYAVGSMPIQAASAGADHLRDRYWFVADANDAGSQGRRVLSECASERSARPDGVAHADQSGSRKERQQRSRQFGGAGGDTSARDSGDLAESDFTNQRRYSGDARGASSAGRDETWSTDGDASDGPCSGRFEWVIGADGKARRVGTDIRRLVDGLPAFLAGLRPECYDAVTQKMRTYASTTQTGPAEILQAMWCGVSPEDDRLPLGGQDRIYAERILLSCLCECARRYEPTRLFGESQEATREVLRGMQLAGKSARTPRQWRHYGEHTGEHSDALRSLSHSFSQYVVASWSAHFRANAEALRLLEHGVPARVAKLRAFGNAIDPRPAIEFIQSVMDIL